jgi:hypothetical protein
LPTMGILSTNSDFPKTPLNNIRTVILQN